MTSLSTWHTRVPMISTNRSFAFSYSLSKHKSRYHFLMQYFHGIPMKSSTLRAKKSNSQVEPVVEQNIVEEVLVDDDDDEEQLLFDDLIDEELIDEDEDFEDEYLEDEAELYVGDGGGGGGISLAGTWWDKEVLRLAEEVCNSFEGELGLYAFKTLSNSTIQVRIERLTNKSGSPSMEDIEAFHATYHTWLDKAELAETVPNNVALEVSSPGVERVVRIPGDLDRFKDRPMYVKYMEEVSGTDASSESDGIFRLISFDTETECCTWGLANVRKNREKSGKGRPLSKKQKEWRLNTPFQSLRLVRLYSEI